MKEGKKQADRDRLDILRLELADCGAQRRFVELAQHPTAKIDPLFHFAGTAGRHQHRRLVVHHVEDGRTIGPALFRHLVDSAESLGHQQAGPHTLALEQRVGTHRGAMAKEGDGIGRDAARKQRLDALQNCARGIVGGRRHLADRHFAGGFVEIDEIGECPAGVDRDAVATHFNAPRAKHGLRRPRQPDDTRIARRGHSMTAERPCLHSSSFRRFWGTD